MLIMACFAGHLAVTVPDQIVNLFISTFGFARLLPGPYHVPTVLFLPQFLPLGLLIFWMIRVRFTDFHPRGQPRLNDGA